MMRLFFSFTILMSVFFFPAHLAFAQKNANNKETFKEAEDSLMNLAYDMFNSMQPNAKMEAGLSFGKYLFQTLKEEGSFKYPFDSLGMMIHVLYPEDKSFRIFNWLVVSDINIVRYYSIIQTKDNIYPLVNYSEQMEESQTLMMDQLDAKHWFGAEYYKLLSRKYKGNNYYFLMGYNRHGTYANKKILDVLTFSEDGPVFGAPVFEFPDERGNIQLYHRILWQYKQESSFYLDFDPDNKIIAFDELRSQINNPLRKNTYVPTGQIDGLKWSKGKWVFKSKVIEPMQLKDGQAPINGVIQK